MGTVCLYTAHYATLGFFLFFSFPFQMVAAVWNLSQKDQVAKNMFRLPGIQLKADKLSSAIYSDAAYLCVCVCDRCFSPTPGPI